MAREKIILCFGDSLTAGYGFTEEHSYPGLLQEHLDKKGYSYQVINAGVSGETTEGGLKRIDRLSHIHPDIFILELGINDGLRGLPIDSMRKNLQGIIDKVKKQNPDVVVVLAGMQVPLNIQNNYIRQFLQVYPELAEKTQAILIPFFLQDVMGVKPLNLPDGLHPNKEGYKIIAANVLKVILPLLDEPAN